MMEQARFCVVSYNMFILTDAVIILLVYLFDQIVLDITSVSWIRNKSIVFACLSYP